MTIDLTLQTVAAAGAALTAVTAFSVAFARLCRWIDHQKQQDKDLAALRELHQSDTHAIREEQAVIIYGLLGALKGLREQGCNGPVKEAIDRIEKHINKEAHR